MAVEAATYIGQLDATNPNGSAKKYEGDDHLRLVKAAIKATFPGLTNATPVTMTEAQLNNIPNLAPKASPVFTGVPEAPTPAFGTNTTQIATMAAVQAAASAAVGMQGLLNLTISNAASVALVIGQQDAATYVSGAVTWTLPASPVAGDCVGVIPCNARTDNVIARNGNPIMGLAEDMTVDNANAAITLRFINASVGWRVI